MYLLRPPPPPPPPSSSLWRGDRWAGSHLRQQQQEEEETFIKTKFSFHAWTGMMSHYLSLHLYIDLREFLTRRWWWYWFVHHCGSHLDISTTTGYSDEDEPWWIRGSFTFPLRLFCLYLYLPKVTRYNLHPSFLEQLKSRLEWITMNYLSPGWMLYTSWNSLESRVSPIIDFCCRNFHLDSSWAVRKY